MDLFKTILEFVAKIANPLVVIVTFLVFRKELKAILVVLRDILKNVKSGRLPFSVGNFTVGKLAEHILSEDPVSAAKTIQKLLSPAAPLALGYVDNFIAGFKVKEDGGISLEVIGDSGKYEIVKVFTIFIPHEISDEESISKNLIAARFPGKEIKNMSIESTGGRPFTGSAMLHEGRLFPIDVPKTLTSIRHVFKFREKQLRVEGKMKDEEIEKLENENLDEFADIIEKRIETLRMSGCVRVVRKQSAVFSQP
jgi:hypothetical protein